MPISTIEYAIVKFSKKNCSCTINCAELDANVLLIRLFIVILVTVSNTNSIRKAELTNVAHSWKSTNNLKTRT